MPLSASGRLPCPTGARYDANASTALRIIETNQVLKQPLYPNLAETPVVIADLLMEGRRLLHQYENASQKAFHKK